MLAAVIRLMICLSQAKLSRGCDILMCLGGHLHQATSIMQ